MFMVDLLGWWYSRGWAWAANYLLVLRNQRVLELFSVSALSKTLFAPYRQTFAGSVSGPIGNKLRGGVDNLISRVIGLIVRIALLLGAFVMLVINTGLGFLGLILWPAVPASPLIALILIASGVSGGV